MKTAALTLFRMIFGLLYLAIGIYWTYLNLKGQSPGFPAFSAAEKSLTSALTEARFFEPAVIFSCVVGGALVLFNRTAPAGIIVLTPLIVIIFLYHAYLTGAFLHATPQLAWLLGLYWLYRRAFLQLLSYKSSAAT